MTVKKIADIGKENKNDDVVLNAVVQVSQGIENISKRQIDFEKNTTDAYNKMADVIADIRKEMSVKNPVAQTPITPAEQVEVNGVQMNDVSGNSVDSEGINWGGTRQDEFAGKPAGVTKPNQEQTLLKKIGLDSDSAALIINKIIDAILNKGTNQNTATIFQEFMMRDFFDNYQSNRMLQKSLITAQYKKDLLSKEDYDQLSKNYDITNDPINAKIAALHNPQGEKKK